MDAPAPERTRVERSHALPTGEGRAEAQARPDAARLLVFSSLFPHAGQPGAGLFIRERMFRVGERLPLVVVAPVPWFPFQGLIRRFRPHFRPAAPYQEVQQGFVVYHPKFLSFPGVLKCLDGLFMALGALSTVRRLSRSFRFELIDAHFAYPDGYAATLLARWSGVPAAITLRGTELRHARSFLRRRLMVKAMQRAARLIAVSGSLKRLAESLGIAPEKVRVVGNGVDTERFRPLPKAEARSRLGLPPGAPVLITVGGLVERKGFHRVIELLPALREQFPGLRYLVVGGASGEGDWSARLRQMVTDLALDQAVRFLGPLPQEELCVPLSAADLFVLPSRNEGWANVLLEAMACGLPVVVTDVGGNAEVVSSTELGTLVPFGDRDALAQALVEGLKHRWDRERIIAYTRENSWDSRVAVLADEFQALGKL